MSSAEQEAVAGEPDAARRQRALEAVASRTGLRGPASGTALRRAYDVTWTYTAPFLTKVASDMLPDLRRDVVNDPAGAIVFVGRDGHSLAIALRRLDPDLFDLHGVETVLSRAVVEAAVRDLEQHAGKAFPQLAPFRTRLAEMELTDVEGARLRLTDYLRACGVPVGRPSSTVTLVDTSYKGTVQELLSAVYPETFFRGRYVFFGASPHDPHPGSKTGYAIHLEADRSWGGLPVTRLPEDEHLVFAHGDAISAVEDTLHGPLSSPVTISRTGPVQHAYRLETQLPDGLNPLRVSPLFTDPSVREGVLDINLIALHDYAARTAARVQRVADWSVELESGFTRFRSEVSSWIARSGASPEFAEVMDSFVLRADKAQVLGLKRAIRDAKLSTEQASRLWHDFDGLATLEQRQAFVAQHVRPRLEGQDRGPSLGR